MALFQEQFPVVFRALNSGFMVSVHLFCLTLLGALPIGLLIALGSMSKFKPLSVITNLFVWIIRGTPLMIQLLIIFYSPGLVFGLNNFWPKGQSGRFTAAVIGFIINYSCYFSEIYRGGIQSIPVGQKEAGQVLGMTNNQIFFRITLLQVIKRIVPPVGNEVITLVKDTALANVIALQELLWAGEAFIKGSQGISGQVWPMFFTAVYYLLFSGALTILLKLIEKKLEYFRG